MKEKLIIFAKHIKEHKLAAIVSSTLVGVIVVAVVVASFVNQPASSVSSVPNSHTASASSSQDVSSEVSSDASSNANSSSEISSEAVSSSKISNVVSSKENKSSKPSLSSSKPATSSKPSSSQRPSSSQPSSSSSSGSAENSLPDPSVLTFTKADIGKCVGTDLYVTDVKEGITSEGLKKISVVVEASFGGWIPPGFTMIECRYCHDMPCPNGGKEKCIKYNEKLDPLITCQQCSKPYGKGTNGTCIRWLFTSVDCPNCGEHVNANTCHTCK